MKRSRFFDEQILRASEAEECGKTAGKGYAGPAGGQPPHRGLQLGGSA